MSQGPWVLSLVHKGEGRGLHSSIFGSNFLLFSFSDSTRLVQPKGVACGGGWNKQINQNALRIFSIDRVPE